MLATLVLSQNPNDPLEGTKATLILVGLTTVNRGLKLMDLPGSISCLEYGKKMKQNILVDNNNIC